MEMLSSFAQLGIGKLLWGLAALFVCVVATKVLMRLFEESLKHMHNVEPALHSMLRSTLKIVLYFVSVMVAAGVMGIPVTSFLALFSVVGLAVSLAVQGVLTNLAGGVIIVVSKMFKLEDYIESDTISGTVKEIGFLHTRLLSPDGKLIYVPNSMLHSARVINYTASGVRRIDLPISASYDNHPAQVREAAMSVVRSMSTVLQDPAPEVVVDSYGDNSIQYIVRVWTTTNDFWPTRHAMNEAMYDAFKAHGVEMTYPHLNVHMK